MKISEIEKQKLEELYQSYLNDSHILEMKNIPMHRGSNCYIHTFKVIKLAIKMGINKRNIDLEKLLKACLFHDYYLYNWREDRKNHKWHGRNHPKTSLMNAERDFGPLDNEVKNAILSHMWPLHFFHFPKSKIAWILTLADKCVATREALTSKKHKEKHHEEYMMFISHLFDK